MSYKKDRGFPVPEIPEDYTDTICFSGEIPDLPEYRAALNASVLGLAKWLAWEKRGIGDNRATRSAHEVARHLIPSYVIGDDMGCGGNCNNDCLCQLVAIFQQQIINNTVINNQLPDIDPKNPETTYPSLDPATNNGLEMLNAAICNMSQSTVETIFTAIYRGQLAVCGGDNEPDWQLIGSSLSTLFLATAALPAAAAAVPALVALGIASAGFAFGDALMGFNFVPDGDNCPPPQPDDELVRVYGCQLWQHLLDNGLTYSAFKSAFECPNPQAQARLDDLHGEGNGVNLDRAMRNDLSIWVNDGNLYQALVSAIDAYASSAYSSSELCPDCTDCGLSLVELRNVGFAAPQVINVSPMPDRQITETRWEWDACQPVTITLDKPYCIQSVGFSLYRGATTSKPSFMDWRLGTEREIRQSLGVFGVQHIRTDLSPDEVWTATQTVTLIPEAGNHTKPFDIDIKDLHLRVIPDYKDC